MSPLLNFVSLDFGVKDLLPPDLLPSCCCKADLQQCFQWELAALEAEMLQD